MIAYKFSTAGLILAALFLGSALDRDGSSAFWISLVCPGDRAGAAACGGAEHRDIRGFCRLWRRWFRCRLPCRRPVKSRPRMRPLSGRRRRGSIEAVEFELGQDARAGEVLVRLSDSLLVERVAEGLRRAGCVAHTPSSLRLQRSWRGVSGGRADGRSPERSVAPIAAVGGAEGGRAGWWAKSPVGLRPARWGVMLWRVRRWWHWCPGVGRFGP